MSRLNRAFQEIFGTSQNLIDQDDPRAQAIQRELDAEHNRLARSERQVYHPPGVLSPRRLIDGDFTN